MSYRGIDYGGGITNIDLSNGIRYGVIPMNDLHEWAWDSFEADYGEPTCRECGNAVVEYDDEAHGHYEGRGCADYACEGCERYYDSGDCYGDDPLGWTLDDGEYQATVDSYGDAFILRSPYFTRASFCSPCAPGACHLSSPNEDGERCYCFGHDWFEDDVAPYPVYSVATGERVDPPCR